MSAKIKRIGVLLLVAFLLAGLVAGVYAVSSATAKAKEPKISVGKNWHTEPGVIKAKGMPEPKKNLKDTADPSSVKRMIERASNDIKDAPVGPEKKSK